MNDVLPASVVTSCMLVVALALTLINPTTPITTTPYTGSCHVRLLYRAGLYCTIAHFIVYIG
jgi:hypothetical protein